MTALQMLAKERTDWRAPMPVVVSADRFETGPRELTYDRPETHWLLATPSICYGFAQVDLLQKAWLDALTSRITCAPAVFVLAPDSASAGDTAAQRMVAELRRLSGLTNEEIAPLMGVSRRSLQAWIAGDSISARKETRLRALLDTIRILAADTAPATRERLLDRSASSIRAYDLLAEERYEAAIDVATGRRRQQPELTQATSEPLVAQLDRIEDFVAPAPRLNRKLSGPLRR